MKYPFRIENEQNLVRVFSCSTERYHSHVVFNVIFFSCACVEHSFSHLNCNLTELVVANIRKRDCAAINV